MRHSLRAMLDVPWANGDHASTTGFEVGPEWKPLARWQLKTSWAYLSFDVGGLNEKAWERIVPSCSLKLHCWCYLWNARSISLHIVSDWLIFLSRPPIRFGLLYLVRRCGT